MKKRLAVVVWQDAHSTIDELDADGIRAGHKPNTVHTYGYIVISDEIGVSIAGEWLPANHGGEDTYRNITFILRSMVRSEGPAKRPRRKSAAIGTDTPPP